VIHNFVPVKICSCVREKVAKSLKKVRQRMLFGCENCLTHIYVEYNIQVN
jgi:hypothetical protein